MLGFNRFAFILCYCGHNIYIVFRFREFHRNMSQRKANMLNMFLDLVLLKGFFVCTNRVLFIVCCFPYTLDYIVFLLLSRIVNR